MDTARQILRFSIPGSIFLLHGAVCYLLYRRVQGVPVVDASRPIQDNVAAVIAVVATIPTGFVIYQLYYFRYEPVVRFFLLFWGGRIVRRDRGGQVLRTLDPAQLENLEDIFQREIDRDEIHREVPQGEKLIQKAMHALKVLEIDGGTRTLEKKARRQAYEERWYTHWDVLRSTIDMSAEQNDRVRTEYTTLSDIYHSLGAARTAVTIAWSGVCLLALSHAGRVLDAPGIAFLGLILISALSGTLWVVFYVARGRTWRTAAASLSLGLRRLHWQQEQKSSTQGTEPSAAAS
jgi:hypothetical protein